MSPSADADVGRCHRISDVLVEARDPCDLDAWSELELVTRHGRADGHADESGLDAVRGEGGLEHAPGLFDQPLIDLQRGAASEEVQCGQLPGAPARRGAERDLELLDDLGCRLVFVVGLVVVDRNVELGRLPFVFVFFGRLLVGLVFLRLDVVDEGHRLTGRGRAHVDHVVTCGARAEALARQRRHRTDDSPRGGVHRPDAVCRTHRNRSQGRAGQDQQPGDAEADEHERRAGSRQDALQRDGHDRAEVSARISELVDRSAPLRWTERELQEPCCRDGQKREREREPQPLDGSAATDERDADARERDRGGEAHPADE
jgi:hypothetical protein